MALVWFLCPYKRDPTDRPPFAGRYCAMSDFTPQILADGGRWSETEILGNRAIVKVRASVATLTTIAATPGFRRIPLARLDDPVSSLSSAQRTAIRNEITDAGYTLAELNAVIPDLSLVTLRDVLRFMCRRRLKPRYDLATDTIVLDGPVQRVKPIENVDREIG
jgi:hypothetical protein